MYFKSCFKTIIYTVLFLLLSHTSKSKSFDFKIERLHTLIRDQGWNCTDILEYFFKRSYKYNKLINAIINYNPMAFIEAIELDELYNHSNKFRGKLHCVPIIVKDNIDVANIPTTGGIKALRYSIPLRDAQVISRLKSHGAIVIAKSNLAELAFLNENSEYGGLCKNPFDLRRSCGGSSTGNCCFILTVLLNIL